MIEYINEGVRELIEVLESSPITKHCFLKKAEKRSHEWFMPHMLFVGDLSTSLTVPLEVRERMKPLVFKYGYDVLEEIAQEYLDRNPQSSGLDPNHDKEVE